jgi:putative acetyltransferase
VKIEARDPADPDLYRLIRAQQDEIAAMEGETHVAFPIFHDISFLIGLVDGRGVACGALQRLQPGVGEIKRMYVSPEERGRGRARALLAALEALARQEGLHTVRLETGRFMPAALGLYSSSGYREIPVYGHYIGHAASICFEKAVDNR